MYIQLPLNLQQNHGNFILHQEKRHTNNGYHWDLASRTHIRWPNQYNWISTHIPPWSPFEQTRRRSMFFVSNDQPAQRRNDLEHPELELLWLEIRPNPLRSGMRRRRPLLVRLLLSSDPNSTNEFFEHLESVLDKITDMDMILLGVLTPNIKNSLRKILKMFMVPLWRTWWTDLICPSYAINQRTWIQKECQPVFGLSLHEQSRSLISPGGCDGTNWAVRSSSSGRTKCSPLQLKHPRCNFITPWSSNCQNEVAFPSTGRRKEVGCILAWKLDTRVCGEGRYQRNLETLEGTVLSRHKIIHWARN